MKIAYLNLCHCDPDLTARAAKKLTNIPNFDMYIHVDLKSDIAPFLEKMEDSERIFFLEKRYEVYWGGFQAIRATLELLRTAVQSEIPYDRYVILQNLDYPIKSNQEILKFFEDHANTEYIRACKIAQTKDWHFAEKYKIIHTYDGDSGVKKDNKVARFFHNVKKYIKSIPNLRFDGIIRENGEEYPIYYGAAQWAITDACARYILEFADTHPIFNEKMKHIKFPDEEYFHTIVHNSAFKYRCVRYDEPEQRWLVNWRNLHYFEYPKEITVFESKDFEKLMSQEALYCRKVRTGISDELLHLIDHQTDATTKRSQ